MKSHTYLGNLQSVHYHKKEVELEEVLQLMEFFKNFPMPGPFFPLSLFVLDYTERKYKLLNTHENNIWGHHIGSIMEGGLDFVLDKYHPEDLKVNSEAAFPKTMSLLRDTPPQERQNLLFSYNYRMKAPNGRYHTALQKNKFITSPEGNPLISYGLTMDITPTKINDQSIMYTADRIHEKGEGQYVLQNLHHDYFFPNPDESILSRKEREILSWMADGFSSKQIADKLRISENTIANHRKNMLRKTNTKNVAHLVKYGLLNGLLC